MTDSTVTPGMRRDLDAMRRADERFGAEHGTQARRRWSGLGGSGGTTLADLQLDAIESGAAATAAQAWAAIAWELDLRVDLVEAARNELRAEERGEMT